MQARGPGSTGSTWGIDRKRSGRPRKSGEQARRLNGAGTGETALIVAGAIAAAAAVGFLILRDALGTDPGDDD